MNIILATLLSIFVISAFADGKFYSDHVPADIPYQRAIIDYYGNTETLVIESKFVAVEGKRFGWVIPVPSVPEIEALDELSIERLYSELERKSKPFNITPYLAFITVIIWFFYRGYQRIRYGKPQPLWRWSNTTVIMAVILKVIIQVDYQSVRGIDVLQEKRVGPYETKVIKGDSAVEMIDWLLVNGFAFGQQDRAVFADYIKRKWVFVVAKLDAGVQGSGGKMVPPLYLSFKSPYAVYPLALTGTSGHNTEVMLYVHSTTRMDADGRLPLQFVGKYYYGRIEGYETKFRGQLTPQQMQSDIIFKPAANNALYRRWELSYVAIDYILGPFILATFIMIISLFIYYAVYHTFKAIYAESRKNP